jgi:hypothetical protein
MEQWREEMRRRNIDADSVDFNNMIEGYSSYDRLVRGMSWTRQIRRPPAPRR